MTQATQTAQAGQLKLGVIGADGRMGRAVIEGADAAGFDVVAQVSEAAPDLTPLKLCDVVIDFSVPGALVGALPALNGIPLVSGTTGLSEAQEAMVAEAATDAPILRSGNFSLGVNVLMDLAQRAARALGPDWDIEILEVHHRAKIDAPSGTALMLGEAAAKGRGVSLSDVSAIDRNGARREGDIGFAVMRGGGVFGMHEVRLISGSEMITLGHQAMSRALFAEGALSAARWIIGKAPGLYAMSDVIEGP